MRKCTKCGADFEPTPPQIRRNVTACKTCLRAYQRSYYQARRRIGDERQAGGKGFWLRWLQSPIAKQFATGKGRWRGTEWTPHGKLIWAEEDEPCQA